MCDDFGSDTSFDSSDSFSDVSDDVSSDTSDTDFDMEDVSDDTSDSGFDLEDVSDDTPTESGMEMEDISEDTTDSDFGMEDVSDNTSDSDLDIEDVSDDTSAESGMEMEDVSDDTSDSDFDMEDVSDDTPTESGMEMEDISDDTSDSDLDMEDVSDDTSAEPGMETEDVSNDALDDAADDAADEYHIPDSSDEDLSDQPTYVDASDDSANDAADEYRIPDSADEDLSDHPTYVDASPEVPHYAGMSEEELAEYINEHRSENGAYDLMESAIDDENMTDGQKDAYISSLMNEIAEGENQETEYGQRVKGLTYDGRDIITKPPEDVSTGISDTSEDSLGELTDQDYDTIYEGLDHYDFHGVDCMEDTERLDSCLVNFEADNWENLSLNDQKEQMKDLAQYVIDVTGLKNPPDIEFYNNDKNGDYGGFNPETNTLSINEHMLYENDEAADTVAHELWHAYQHECAQNPRTKMDQMYAENFDNYIKPKDDFTGYQSQLIESEARAFAQQIKDRLHAY